MMSKLSIVVGFALMLLAGCDAAETPSPPCCSVVSLQDLTQEKCEELESQPLQSGSNVEQMPGIRTDDPEIPSQYEPPLDGVEDGNTDETDRKEAAKPCDPEWVSVVDRETGPVRRWFREKFPRLTWLVKLAVTIVIYATVILLLLASIVFVFVGLSFILNFAGAVGGPSWFATAVIEPFSQAKKLIARLRSPGD